jgi:protein-tyrosine phosphatase
MSYVDLHLHLLPGADDGAPDEAVALEHAARMVSAGVGEATVTPHVGSPWFPVDLTTIADRTAALQTALDREGIALALRPGGEIHPNVAGELSARELDAIAQGPAGARWVLAEVPFAGIDAVFVEALRSIARQGFGLLIGHPERAANALDGGLRLLRPLVETGAVLQVNVCSLMGRHGPEAREAGSRLLRSRMAYVLASDGHPGTRDHLLPDGMAPALAAGATRTQVEQLTRSNPRFLLRHGMPAATRSSPRRVRSLELARTEARRLARAD